MIDFCCRRAPDDLHPLGTRNAEYAAVRGAWASLRVEERADAALRALDCILERAAADLDAQVGAEGAVRGGDRPGRS